MRKRKDWYCASLHKGQGGGCRLVSLTPSSGTIFEQTCLEAISQHMLGKQMTRCSRQGFTKAAGQPSYLPWGSDWLCERGENQSILFTLTLARPSTPSATASLQANWRERVWVGVHEGRWKTNSTCRLKAEFHSLQPDGG